MKNFLKIVFITMVCVSVIGCGYTTSALRGEKIQKLHVETFLNRTYEHGLDRMITDAVIDEFIFKGGVKVVEEDNAEVILSGVVKDYVLKPLSYNRENQAEEYRLRVSVDVSLEDRLSGGVIWEAKDVAGEWTFLFSGPLRISEEEAREKAIKYLAREIVQRSLEMW